MANERQPFCIGITVNAPTGGWVMLRFSAKLPVSEFFKYSSALIAVLAVVLAGKGIAALQEAGLIDIAPLSQMPRIPVLGLFPTWESFGAQLLTLGIIAAGAWYNGRPTREPIAAREGA